MRLGIFAKTFVRPTLAETLDAVVARGTGLHPIQFRLRGPAQSARQNRPGPGRANRARGAQRKLTVAAVSGTFNMIDPDLARRQAACGGWRNWRPVAPGWARRSSPFAPARAIRRTCGVIIRTTIRRKRGGICSTPWPPRWKLPREHNIYSRHRAGDGQRHQFRQKSPPPVGRNAIAAPENRHGRIQPLSSRR